MFEVFESEEVLKIVEVFLRHASMQLTAPQVWQQCLSQRRFVAALGSQLVILNLESVFKPIQAPQVECWQVWFAFINFLGDELYHPLDFFSNKMRTRCFNLQRD